MVDWNSGRSDPDRTMTEDETLSAALGRGLVVIHSSACPAGAGARCVVCLPWRQAARLAASPFKRSCRAGCGTRRAYARRTPSPRTTWQPRQSVFYTLPSSPRPRWSLPNQSFLILPGNSGLAAGGAELQTKAHLSWVHRQAMLRLGSAQLPKAHPPRSRSRAATPRYARFRLRTWCASSPCCLTRNRLF